MEGAPKTPLGSGPNGRMSGFKEEGQEEERDGGESEGESKDGSEGKAGGDTRGRARLEPTKTLFNHQKEKEEARNMHGQAQTGLLPEAAHKGYQSICNANK